MATDISRTDDGHIVVWFEDDAIRTTLSDSGDVVDSWLDEIYRIHRRRLNRLVVGLDVEWRPCTSREDVHPVAVLQICVGHRCLVFQILHADYIPESLSGFLADDRFTFVGVGVHDDAAKLRSDYGLEVGRAVDLRSLAASTLKKPALGKAGLQALVSEVMGVEMEKPQRVRRSAWDARNLSSDQLMYACADAFASFEVGRWLYDGDGSPAWPLPCLARQTQGRLVCFLTALVLWFLCCQAFFSPSQASQIHSPALPRLA